MGIRIPMCQGCGVGVLRIATPACGLVRNDRDRGRGGCRRRHTWVPPYGCVTRGAVRIGGGVWSPRPTEDQKKKLRRTAESLFRLYCSQKSALPTVRGCSSTSRMLLTPVRYMTIRSKPRPKPACLQEP